MNLGTSESCRLLRGSVPLLTSLTLEPPTERRLRVLSRKDGDLTVIKRRCFLRRAHEEDGQTVNESGTAEFQLRLLHRQGAKFFVSRRPQSDSKTTY